MKKELKEGQLGFKKTWGKLKELIKYFMIRIFMLMKKMESFIDNIEME